MCEQSVSELLATAKLHLLTVAQELEKNGIDLYKVKLGDCCEITSSKKQDRVE